jgi:hypothetical protein
MYNTYVDIRVHLVGAINWLLIKTAHGVKTYKVTILKNRRFSGNCFVLVQGGRKDTSTPTTNIQAPPKQSTTYTPNHKLSHHKRPCPIITHLQKLKSQPKNKSWVGSSMVSCLAHIALNTYCQQTVQYPGPHLKILEVWRHMTQIMQGCKQPYRSTLTLFTLGLPQGHAITVGLSNVPPFLETALVFLRVPWFSQFVLLVRAACRWRWWKDRETKLGLLGVKPVPQCHFVHHMSHVDWPGIEPRCPWWHASDQPS